MTYTELIFIENENVPKLYSLNNPYVINKLNRIKSNEYILHSATGYALLGKMMSERFNIDINSTDIIENEYGKPCFADYKIKFSISHTKGAVACSISESEIGIDIEKISEIRENILKLYTKREMDQILTPADFYTLWTLKESAIKMTGKGISDIKKHEFILRPEITCISDCLYKNTNHKAFIVKDFVMSLSTADTIDQPVII